MDREERSESGGSEGRLGAPDIIEKEIYEICEMTSEGNNRRKEGLVLGI